ncbi:bifunctional DNA-formamidopyrimidine glycosylase/DNA-(apurinic or apyrimidinic site) lyase [Mycoplasma sp. VS410B]|uniref:bifunctional DNA-formamidopyrimidine glycosylase/DNA-(apurinic or apyrimidinic site) lyase n=1 Tax=Mycoplasma sp. VS410B TaxID=3401688 RepID=UPI003AAE0960
MPEYPEVTVVTNTLNSLTSGHKIIAIEVFKDKLIKNASQTQFIDFLKNKIIKEICNYGKFILFTFDDNSRMISHLRMSGKYFVLDVNSTNPMMQETHNYIYFYLDNNTVMIYNDARMFGSFEIIPSSDTRNIYEIKNLAKLPHEVDVDALWNKLQHKNISIKAVLLDQSLVLGVGNIYADEALYRIKMYPMLKCNKVSKTRLAQLLQAAGDIMNDSVAHGGSSVHTYVSVNSKRGSYQNKLKVYGKDGQLCSTCRHSLIKKVKLDYKQNGRGTSFCPNCQKEING